MGYDYSNHHVFVGDGDAESIRLAIIGHIKTAFPTRTTNEEDATRCFAVGPAGRWIFVGDTAGSTNTADSIAFADLAIALSNIAPTMSVKVSDSCTVHILLYQNGVLLDTFGNGIFPFFRFASDDEARAFQGDMSVWSPYVMLPYTTQELRQAWNQEGHADVIVQETGKLFSINAQLVKVGYSIFDEALEIKYTDWMKDYKEWYEKFINLQEFDEFYVLAD
jgi:hypothetical protein